MSGEFAMQSVTMMSIPITELTDVEHLQRTVIYLYDLLDDISTVDDMAKSDDKSYRESVDRIQAKKNDSGVSSPDGYYLQIRYRHFLTKDEAIARSISEV